MIWRKRCVHQWHSSLQASKGPDNSLRHATGGRSAVKCHHCHPSVPSASLSPDPPSSAATCCRHQAATMGCHLIMNPEGARHWFKVPLPSQCREAAGMMTEVRPFAGSRHRWCFFHKFTVGKLCCCWTITFKACGATDCCRRFSQFASFWSVNVSRNLSMA